MSPASTMADPQSMPTYERLRASIHIHSTYSTGAESLQSIAELAHEHGVDVLVVTDDDLLEVSYGLAPWRRLLRYTESDRSLLGEDTLEEYLEEVRRLDASFEDLIVLDGIESAPYYTWDVDWQARRWTVRGWNRHLLAVGLDDAGAYRALPILGGEGEWLPQDGGSILRMLWPLLGLFYAVRLSRRMHGGRVRLIICVACLIFLVDGALKKFRTPRFTAYENSGVQPYQDWIDAVAAAGGLSYWAHPEAASTIPPRSIAGVAQVRNESQGHAEDLVDTRHYTGFAALYGDTITATEPGREWDQTLISYLRGDRARPAWGMGEIDFHRNEPGGRLHDIQTVLLVDQRTRRGVLEALSRGRGYAVRGGDEALSLRRWRVRTDAGEAVSGQLLASSGESSKVMVTIDKENGLEERVDLRLIRGDTTGRVEVVAQISGNTPFQVEHVEAEGPAVGCYYRLLVRSGTSVLSSNPIFVRGDG